MSLILKSRLLVSHIIEAMLYIAIHAYVLFHLTCMNVSISMFQ